MIIILDMLHYEHQWSAKKERFNEDLDERFRSELGESAR